MTAESIFEGEAASLVGDVDADLLDAVAAHWSTTFESDERSEDVSRALGLSPALANSLGVGLSDRTLGLRIPSRELKAGRLLRERLAALGILRASGHEAFRGCWWCRFVETVVSLHSLLDESIARHRFSGRVVCPAASLSKP